MGFGAPVFEEADLGQGGFVGETVSERALEKAREEIDAQAKLIYDHMLNSHLSIAREQAEKKAKAEEQIAATGKTKLSWDETVLAKEYVWHLDIVMAELKLTNGLRPSVLLALEGLHETGLLKRLSLVGGQANWEGLGQATSCFAVPLANVLGQLEKLPNEQIAPKEA